MKKLMRLKTVILAGVLIVTMGCRAQSPVNWTEKQLMEPADLAGTLASKKDLPFIISVGPGAIIPGSVTAGMASTPEGLNKLKAELQNLPKDKKVVIYCGCCPFEHCPNVRPAIDVLKSLGFTNYFLLDLPNNIKKDWIDKGYPVSKQ